MREPRDDDAFPRFGPTFDPVVEAPCVTNDRDCSPASDLASALPAANGTRCSMVPPEVMARSSSRRCRHSRSGRFFSARRWCARCSTARDADAARGEATASEPARQVRGDSGGEVRRARTRGGQTFPFQQAVKHSRTGEIFLCTCGRRRDRLWVHVLHAAQANAGGQESNGSAANLARASHTRAADLQHFQDDRGFTACKPFIEKWRSGTHMPAGPAA